jgi:hypothetical protein
MTTLHTTAYADEEFVCMIGDVGYTWLEEALYDAMDGETITLLTDIESIVPTEVDLGVHDMIFSRSVAIFVSGKAITIDTNGFVLDVGKRFPGGRESDPYFLSYGVWVEGGGKLSLVDNSPEQTGRFSVTTQYCAIWVDGNGSEATISSVETLTNYDSCSVLAENGGTVTVIGDVLGGKASAVQAYNGGLVTVFGNVTSSAVRTLVSTGAGSSVEVYGDVTSTLSDGLSGSTVYSTANACIKVHGNVSSDATCGVLAEGANTTVEIKGNLSAAQGTGVQAVGGATVSIDGTLTASDYIKLGTSSNDTTSYPKESGRYSQRKPNYYEYTDNTNYVYVRSDGSIIDNSAGVPGSGDLYGRGYASMDVALAVARIVVGAEVNLSPPQFAAIDMDFDGVLTMTDVLLIMRKACGL